MLRRTRDTVDGERPTRTATSSRRGRYAVVPTACPMASSPTIPSLSSLAALTRLPVDRHTTVHLLKRLNKTLEIACGRNGYGQLIDRGGSNRGRHGWPGAYQRVPRRINGVRLR